MSIHRGDGGKGKKVQKASTHQVCTVAANGASVKGHGATIDQDAATTLHLDKEVSIHRGDG